MHSCADTDSDHLKVTVITARFSEYKDTEALYSSGSDVSVHWSSHSTQRRRFNLLKVSTKKTSENIFQREIYCTFSFEITSQKSRHSTLAVNATVLTSFSVEELTLKQFLTMNK